MVRRRARSYHVGMGKPVCAVVGIGPGNGASFARRFAKEGYAVALLSRATDLSNELAKSLPDARAYGCDVGDEGSIDRAFDQVVRDLGEIDVLVYNAGSGVWGTIEEVGPAEFESSWRVNALGAFLTSRKVIPAMKRRGSGTVVFIGATASRRGFGRRIAPVRPDSREIGQRTGTVGRRKAPTRVAMT